MHNRRKTGIAKDAKREEEELKRIGIYSKLRDEVLEKRNHKNYSIESLKVTTKLLTLVSDFYTAWNFRREIILHLAGLNRENDPHSDRENDISSLINDELSFLQQVIGSNPKSYWAWHYRKWITTMAPQLGFPGVDWQKELGLCSKLLSMDDRNFHCWSYRRYVAAQLFDTSEVQGENSTIAIGDDWLSPIISRQLNEEGIDKELEFTTERIEKNFSNYSSWHQRSILLPQKSKIDGGVLESELEYVRGALYTEPADQSGFLYHRWLLGRHSSTASLLSRVIVVASTEKSVKVLAIFRESVGGVDDLIVASNGHELKGEWKPVSIERNSDDLVWVFAPSMDQKYAIWTGLEMMVTVETPEQSAVVSKLTGIGERVECRLKQCDENCTIVVTGKRREETEEGGLVTVLHDELDQCDELLDTEPNSVLPMQAKMFVINELQKLESKPLSERSSETTTNLSPLTSDIVGMTEKLMKLDPQRRQYFRDLRSHAICNDLIKLPVAGEQRIDTDSSITVNNSIPSHLALSNFGLTQLYYTERLATLLSIDLSHNFLVSLKGIDRCFLLRELIVDHNQISCLQLSPLTKLGGLRKLSLIGNPLEYFSNDIRQIPVQCNEVNNDCDLPKLSQISSVMVNSNIRTLPVFSVVFPCADE